jgi:glutamate-1-semialdehyde 2,1-aminomutase
MSAEPTVRTDPQRKRDLQLATWRRATRVMPGGTDSNFRAWGEDTIYVDRGKGATVWDMDGNEYVDLRMGYGPVILGHADDRVDDYVNERMRRGVSFSLTSEDEIRANELLQELTGWVEMSRLTVSGTEATMHAMRVARAFTGRNKIVKFEGQYHGVHDYALISVLPNNVADLGDAENPSRLAWGRGIPDAVAATVIPARYNNVAHLRRLFEREGHDIAAIIVEPVLGNAQGIMPQAGFHEAMRSLTREFGILLIFDEVKTGFRLAKGGAAEYFGITPDLATFAKAMGNGYPAAAFGGRRDIMSLMPKSVSHGGTYAGNRIAAVGGGADARDPARHGCARHGPPHRRRDPGRHSRGARSHRAALRHHGAPVDVRDHVHGPDSQRVPRLGGDRPRAVRRDRGGHARTRRDARAGQPGAVVHLRGARAGRHGRPGRLDLRRLCQRRPGGARTWQLSHGRPRCAAGGEPAGRRRRLIEARGHRPAAAGWSAAASTSAMSSASTPAP